MGLTFVVTWSALICRVVVGFAAFAVAETPEVETQIKQIPMAIHIKINRFLISNLLSKNVQ
jgi:hypothetical protein